MGYKDGESSMNMKSNSPRLLCLVVSFALTSLATAQVNTITPKLGARTSQSEFAVLSSTDYVRHHWEGNSLISSGINASPSNPVVVVHDDHGTLVAAAVVWFPDAKQVSVADAAVDSEGRIVVSGGAVRADGSVANFIARVGNNGRVEQVIQTNPYLAYYLRPASDGTVWTLGVERNAQSVGSKEFRVLRQFSFAQGTVFTALDSTSLPQPATKQDAVPWYGSFPGGMHIANHGQTLGFYSARTSEWIAIDLQSHAVMRQTLARPASGVEVTGVAFTDSGKVFASLRTPGDEKALNGLAELTLQKGQPGRWTMVSGAVSQSDSTGDRAFAFLLGESGNQLVYRPDRFPSETVAWVAEPR